METSHEPTSTAPRTRIRWWPLAVIVVGALVAVLIIQGDSGVNQQEANMRSALAAIIAGLAAVLWLLLLSRLAGRAKLGALVGGTVVLALFLVNFRLVGVTGDLIPIFELRWGARAAPEVSPTASKAALEPVAGLADYPQFFGPQRDGHLPGPELSHDWDATPPELLWRRPVGAAWSGFAVRGRRAITQEQFDNEEAVVCYDIVTGDVLWVHRDAARYDNALAGIGPRATPTISNDRVFAQGATGRLNCLDLATGDVVWTRNILDDNSATTPEWGVAGSPLIAGDRVIVNAGGPEGRSLVAYAAADGKFVWGGGSDDAHWSSPVLTRLAGTEQVLMFTAHGVSGHDVSDGRVLWTHPWPSNHPHVCMPVAVGGDRVLVSSGYGTGSQLVQIARDAEGTFSSKRIWKSLTPKAKFTNLVVKDGFIYGLDDGAMACVDLETGRRKWKKGRDGHGQLILVGDLLLVTAEGGEVLLLEATPDGRRELARFRAFERKTWNPPTLAGELLLVRNDEEAACYRLPVEGQ